MGFNGPATANRTGRPTANDSVMTPTHAAKQIIQALPLTGTILEPCRGNGAFYNQLPAGTQWCEITQGRDFFDFVGCVDWIVTNPPYSIYDKFLDKCFDVADNVALLVPLSKCLKSIRIERMVDDYGGLRQVRIMGGGSKFGFPFGFLTGVLWYQRGYRGPIERVNDPLRLRQAEGGA